MSVERQVVPVEGIRRLVVLAFLALPAGTFAQFYPTNGPVGAEIQSLAVDGTKLFAGTGSGAFLTKDGGALWTPINNGLSRGSYGSIRAMLKEGAYIFLGGNGVFRTGDDGQTWTRVLSDSLQSATYALAAGGGYLYAAGETNAPLAPRKWRVFRSADFGDTWTEVDAGLPDDNGHIFSALAARGSTVLLGTSGGIYRSSDEGGTWNYTSGSLVNQSTFCFAVSPTTFYAGLGGEDYVVTSDDDGISWNSTGHWIDPGEPLRVYSIALYGSNIFAGTEAGVYRSPIVSDNWSLVKGDPNGLTTKAFATIGPVIFAGNRVGVSFSEADGDSDTWSPAMGGLNYTHSNGMIVSGARILDATQGGVAYSDDIGKTWTMAAPAFNTPSGFLINGTDLYVAGATGLHHSGDNGTTWSPIGYPYASECLAMTDSLTMFIGTGSGVARTTDAWSGWEYKNNGLTNTEVHALASIGSKLFAGTSGGGVFLSEDNGDSWTSSNTGLPNLGILRLAVSPDGIGGTRLFAALSNGGVYVSTDDAASWSPANGGLSGVAIYSLCVYDATTLFAGDERGYIWLTTDNGGSWTIVDQGSEFVEESPFFSGYLVNALVITGDVVFAGPGQSGVWYRPLAEMMTIPHGSVTGTVYEDADLSGALDAVDIPVVGQKVYATDGSGTVLAAAVTDSNGVYNLSLPSGGTYTITQERNRSLLQNFPAGDGAYEVSISIGESLTDRDYGNIHTYRCNWLATDWSLPSTWEGGYVPGGADVVSIPGNSHILIDALPNDSVRALRIESGGTLTGAGGMGTLTVGYGVIIDHNSTLTLPTGALPGELRVHSNWVNRGTFEPGESRITLVDSGAVIVGEANFFDLGVEGNKSRSDVNVRIAGSLILGGSLIPAVDDTVFIDNPSSLAISGTGQVVQGTIVRQIEPGSTSPYRFESPSTTIQFQGVGTTPSLLAVTTYPEANTYAFNNFDWKSVGGTSNPPGHTVAFDSVTGFSKWVIGVPRPNTLIGPPAVRRMYAIAQEGGSGFAATVQLRYDPTEIIPGTDPSAFRPMRNPVASVTTLRGWNLISLPLVPEDSLLAGIYANTTPPAYLFDGAYHATTHLEFGKGYWLYFNTDWTTDVGGLDLQRSTIPVNAGWNIIGGISARIATSSITTSPAGLIATPFYRYSRGYAKCDSILPGGAYWVKTSAAGELFLREEGTSASGGLQLKSPALKNPGRLLFTDSDGRKGELYVGGVTGIEDRAFFALPPVPPEGAFDVRYGDQYRVAIADPESPGDYPIEIRGAAYPLTITFEGGSIHQDPGSLRVDTNTVPLGAGASVVVTGSASRVVLHLEAGSSPNIPKEFVLEQNFPNPFNPTTTIRYGLAYDARVTMTLYDVLGRNVLTLKNEDETAGYKSVQLDGSALANGVYFYRMTAVPLDAAQSSFTRVRKLLLVK